MQAPLVVETTQVVVVCDEHVVALVHRRDSVASASCVILTAGHTELEACIGSFGRVCFTAP